MTVEIHPYGHYIPANARCMIIGSFPIGKFSNPKRTKEIKDHEINFFFGGEKNLLWKLLGLTFNRNLSSKKEITKFLEDYGIAIGDVIHSCKRKNGGGSDSDLYDIKWNNNLKSVIEENDIRIVFLTSKKVENWFDRLYPNYIHQKIILVSPSAQSARSIVRQNEFQDWKIKHPGSKIFDYILSKYQEAFSILIGIK